MQFFPNVSTVVPHVFTKIYWATQGQPKNKEMVSGCYDRRIE